MEQILSYASNQGSGASFLELAMWIASAAGLWKMLEAAGKPGWAGLIPFYNWYVIGEVSTGDSRYWLRLLTLFIPIVGWIILLIWMCTDSQPGDNQYGPCPK